MATYTLDGNVGVVALDDTKMNAFGFDMMRSVNAALDAAEQDSSATAVLLRGNKKCFSAGFDLSVMGPAGDAQARADLLHRGGQLVVRMYTFPKPLVAAATGHGLALGAILLLAADLRIGPKAGGKAKFGLNEVAIGMTLPAFGIELARARCPKALFEINCVQAMVHDATSAVSSGFLDMLAEEHGPDAVVARAMAEARRLGKYCKQPAFRRQKMLVRRPVLDLIEPEIQGMAEMVLTASRSRRKNSSSSSSRL